MTSHIFGEFERLSSSVGWRVVVGKNLPDLGKSYFSHFCHTLVFLAITFDPNVQDIQ